jgi:thiamine biosynthesis lipoprotein
VARPEILTPRARLLLPVFLVLLVALTLRSLVCAPLPPRVQLAGATMGTTWSVTLNASDLPTEARVAAANAIEAALADVDARMSTWREDSELSRFNGAPSTDPVAMSPESLEVFALAADVSQRSGGAFDVTVRPLVAAWGFGAGARPPGEEPSAAELAALGERVGYALLVVDREAGTLQKLRPDVEADLSAIAKGYAVDQVAAALEGLGHDDYLVEVGGELRVRGERPAGGPWRLAIERPDPDGRAIHAVLLLDAGALATSGDYRSFWENGGQRRAHIIDPRTGRPSTHGLASVSVVHPDAVSADAWATALSVLGPEEGLALARAEGLAAYFIARSADGSLEAFATPDFPPIESLPAVEAPRGDGGRAEP